MRECPKCGACYGDEVLNCEFHPAETKQILPGSQRLANRYFLERRIGRGAMGQVYLARDENLGTRQVAVKTVRPDLLSSEDLQEGEAIARFEREARLAASIRHPNVVDVTDFGKSAEGVFYLVMEYVKGETLHDLLRREGTLTAKRACNLLTQIGAGIEAAHEVNILHRDLKPANIFLLKTGKKSERDFGDGFIKVGDFGLAKIVGEAQADISAKQGPASRGIIGTPEFMAPEQMHSENPVDARADVYALGAIAYLMLGGRVPFTGDLMQIVTAKMTQVPPPLSRFRTDIAAPVERAIMHALEKEPDKRAATAAEWIEELSRAVEQTADQKDHAGAGRLIVVAPIGAEVYVDDERRGSVGSSGRIVLSQIPPGRHVLRVAGRGLRDDERVIEIRADSAEQIIQAALKSTANNNQIDGAQQSGSQSQKSEFVPSVVVCLNCSARYAAGVKFCGRCGQNRFQILPSADDQSPSRNTSDSGAREQTASRSSAPPNQSQRIRINTAPASQPQQSGGLLICPRCNRQLPVNAKFCGGCGLRLTGSLDSAPASQSPSQQNQFAARPGEAICRRCNTVYKAGTRYCGKCGNQIT